MAARYLKYLLENPRTRTWLLSECRQKTAVVAPLLTILEDSPVRLQAALQNSKEDAAALEAFSTFLKLQLHLESTEGESSQEGGSTGLWVKELANLVSFTNKNVLAGLMVSQQSAQESSDKQPKRKKAKSSAQDEGEDSVVIFKKDTALFLAKFCTEITTLGVQSADDLVELMEQWMDTIIETDVKDSPFLLDLLPILYKLCFQLTLQLGTVSSRNAKAQTTLRSFFKKLLLQITSEAVIAKGDASGWSVRGSLLEMLRSVKTKRSTLRFFVNLLLESVAEDEVVSSSHVLPPASSSFGLVTCTSCTHAYDAHNITNTWPGSGQNSRRHPTLEPCDRFCACSQP